MAIVEDLNAYLADFGVPCSAAGASFTGLLDQPDELMDVQRITAHIRQYLLTYKTADVTLARDAAVVVNSVAYTVREAPRQVDDGAFSRVLLSRA